MRRNILAFLSACILGLGASAQATLGFPGEECASVGIYIKDLRTGEVVAQNDARRALLPASVMKSMTCASTMSLLGLDFTFKTPVYLTGQKSATDPSAWDGDIVIASCGDPTIDSHNFEDRTPLWREIADALNRKGIKSVSGCILIEEPLKDAGYIPEWEICDVPWEYGAGLFGFNFSDNCTMLCTATGVTVPHVPDLWLDLTKSTGGIDMARGIDSYCLSISGKNLNSAKTKISVSIPFPAEAYTALLDSVLPERGIAICHEVTEASTKRTLLCRHESPTLYAMQEETMRVSHNLFAEGLLRALAPNGTRQDALDREWNFFKDCGDSLVKYNKICDGSGLARADRLQPIFISNVLEHMAKSDLAEAYVDCFPLVGKEGTVKRLLNDTRLQGQLALKSGSVNAVQCFAGYKLDADGAPTHTVVILVNSFYCPRAEVKKAIENFLLSTFD